MVNTDRLIEILESAAVRSAGAEREGYIEQACAGDLELKAQIISLLHSHESAGDFLNESIIPSVSVGEEPGKVIGRYRIIEKLGEGGCGEVYAAEQSEPVRRRVALKVIKPGMDSRQVIARFEAERQALAMMDHVNIAKVLDAGSTETGRPYFVMELVRGIRITDFCVENQLSTQERVDLFVKVCNAIQHAHQKGIIHRDIKPSNILVTRQDSASVPKVIDFGIAKAIEGRLSEATIHTQMLHFVGTPAYMSPEQAEMSGLDIDTRSDIYSLGVLLYELLTGQTPFDGQKLVASGIDAMRKTIREQEPIRPSTRLSALKQNPRSDVHPSPSPVSCSNLSTDLDWIIMKCLEKDRARRYQTVNALTSDLQRHLSNQPILARPPTTFYIVQKAWRRNRVIWSAAAAVALALFMGTTVSTWQAFRANKEKAIAEHHLYVANLNLLRQAWEESSLERMRRLLKETGTYPERGFEWFYWQRQAHLNLHSLRGHRDRVTSVAYSRDGRTILTAGWDGTARGWDAGTGGESFQLGGNYGAIHSAAFSPDAHRVVTGGDDGVARVWDVATLQVLFELRGHKAAIRSVGYAPDGNRIVTAGDDQTARIWDSSAGTELYVLRGHSGTVNCIAVSPDGRRIATASDDETTRLWDMETGAQLRVLPGQTKSLCVAFSPDGERLITGNLVRTVTIWKLDTDGSLPQIFPASGPVGTIVFSPDGKSFAAGSWDSTLMIRDAATGSNIMAFRGHSRGVFSVAFSPNGQQLAAAGYNPKVWGFNRQLESPTLGSVGSMGAAFSPDGGRIVTGGTLGSEASQLDNLPRSAEVWDIASEQKLATLAGHTAAIACTAFSPDGFLVVTGSRDQTARIWEAASGKKIARLPGHQGTVLSATFSPDGRWIITGAQDHTARVWNTATHQLRFSLTNHSESVTTAGFSADGKYLVTASLDNTVRIWEAASGKQLRVLKPSKVTNIAAAAFSPDGKWIAAGGWNGAVIWDATAEVEIHHLLGDSVPVSSVSFSPTSKLIVIGSVGGTARVWETGSGRELLTLSGHGPAGMSAAFSPDGLRIVTGSIDTPARLWIAADPSQVEVWEKEDRADEQ